MLPFEEGKTYDLVYTDPPWRYDFSPSTETSIEVQYPTMSLEDIKAIQVPAADDCILLLWATAPKLLEALEVMKAWGFTYKTQAVWDKLITGIGYWFRGQHEILLLGTKGSPSPPIPTLRTSSVFKEHRRGHSKKPACVKEWINKSFPNLTKLEMFARGKPQGWDAWGLEVDGKLGEPKTPSLFGSDGSDRDTFTG